MKLIAAVACACVMVALGNGLAAASDDAFVALANEYIKELFAMDPEWATAIGAHRYDAQLTDRSAEAIERAVATNKRYLARLDAIDPTSLNATNAIDYDILKLNLERMIFEATELQEWKWNPLYYNFGNGIYALLARDFAPLEERLANVRERLLDVRNVTAAARANLGNPPKVHTETAILQNKGNISLIRETVSAFLPPNERIRKEVGAAQEMAIAELESFGEWLEHDLLPRSNRDFRLGEELWQKKLRYTLDSDLSRDKILDLAMADLKSTQEGMYQTALPLYDRFATSDEDRELREDVKLVCRTVLDRLAEERPANENVVAHARRTLKAAIAFVRENELVTVPDEPVKLIVMPEFQRGVAVAYCDSPGPLDRELDTFYAISPTPEDWSEERTTSFFKEYNNYMLHDLTVHEAVPGHYLQLAHSNMFEAPTLVRSVFYSGLFVEGWAVYAEKVMAEAGYGGAEVRMQQLKMRLRVIINAIIDQKVHTEGMNETEAIALMMDEGFQEDGEAAGKWRRVNLTSTQLSTYFVGSAEVEDIATAYRRMHPNVSQRELHDKMISFGSPSPKYVRRMMGL